MRVLLEVIATTVDDAAAAQAGGADRLELVADMEQDGITPDLRLIQNVKRAVRIPVYVMIRPRGGDFVYSEAEVRSMEAAARRAREEGADGIVTGALQKDGSVDLDVTARIVEAAGLPTTFHRAIDASSDVIGGVKQLASIPLVERVLTSGGAPTAYEGLASLVQLCRVSPIEVMPGAGITLENIREIAQKTRARAIHVGSAARTVNVAPVSAARVRALRSALDAI